MMPRFPRSPHHSSTGCPALCRAADVGPSRFHRRAAYTRCLRCAGAPRRPQVVPSFRCAFLPDMPPSTTPGSPDIVASKFTMPTWSSPRTNRLDTAKTPAIRFTRALNFVASLVCNCYGLSGCSPPLARRIRPGHDPATGGFYVQVSDGSVTLPVAGYDYDIDCRRDLPPLEWQRA